MIPWPDRAIGSIIHIHRLNNSRAATAAFGKTEPAVRSNIATPVNLPKRIKKRIHRINPDA